MNLKDACDAVMADTSLTPVKNADGSWTTRCNQGTRLIAHIMDCHDFDDLSLDADAMGAIMAANKSGRWVKATGEQATAHAMAGKLAVSFMSSARLKESHAHIDVVYPDKMQWSGSLGRNVPMVANVGLQNKEEKESQAYPVEVGEADYYLWT